MYFMLGSTGRRPVIISSNITPYENTSDFSVSLPLEAYSGAKYLHLSMTPCNVNSLLSYHYLEKKVVLSSGLDHRPLINAVSKCGLDITLKIVILILDVIFDSDENNLRTIFVFFYFRFSLKRLKKLEHTLQELNLLNYQFT